MHSQPQKQQNLMVILNLIPSHLCLKIISFLDQQTIQLIYTETSTFLFKNLSSKQQNNKIQKQLKEQSFGTFLNQSHSRNLSQQMQLQLENSILPHYLYIQQKQQIFHVLSLFSFVAIINRQIKSTDRSIYFSLYAQNVINNAENQIILSAVQDSQLGQKMLYKWLQADRNINKIFSKATKGLEIFADKTEAEESEVTQFIEELRLIFNDPEIPPPKLRKEGIGSYCNSPLQFFLVDKWHPSNKQKKKNFQSSPPNFLCPLIAYPLQKQSQEDNIFKSSKILVAETILNLLKAYCTVTELWIETHSGEIQKFFAYINRYAIYRGILIGLQNYLGGIFRSEDSSYFQYEKYDDRSSSIIINIGIKIWNEKNKKHEKKNIQTYIKILHFYTAKSLVSKIEENQELQSILQLQEHRWLINTLRLKRISISSHHEFTHSSIKKSLSDPTNRKQLKKQKMHRSISFMSQICLTQTQQFFLQDEFLQQQILREFVEYYIDICVDECSVNWCGHSEQKLKVQYQSFQNEVLEYGMKCIKYFEEVVIFAKNDLKNLENTDAIQKILKYLIGKFFEVWDIGLVKPVTLKKLLQSANGIIQEFQQKINEQPINEMDRYEGQFGMNISEIDKSIEYLNEQIWNIPRVKFSNL